jgi:uncharacterized protein (DUF1501 family)
MTDVANDVANDVAGQPDCGCSHHTGTSGMTRRGLLAAAALGVAGTVVSGAASTRLAFADASYTGDVLVVLSLRGGFDGLSAVVPIADPWYARARPGIGIPSAQLLPLDSTFGLHPALSAVKPLWDAGVLGAVHAVGQPDPTRSHFKAMEEMERAAPGSRLRTGWLDRVTGAEGPGSVFATVGVGLDSSPTSLVGPSPELLLSSLKGFNLAGASDPKERAKWATALRAMHRGAPAGVHGPANATLGALTTAAVLNDAAYVPTGGAAYPKGDLGDSLRDVAHLVKAGVGLRVATVDYGDWDMHVGIGRSDDGWMFRKLSELGAALAAFAADLGDALGTVTLVTLSEFGRRVMENSSGGLDHGHGNLMLMLGGGVAGGQVHGAWPGLNPAGLNSGDLPAANDYRSVLAEVLERRCGLSASRVFPGLSAARLGVVR